MDRVKRKIPPVFWRGIARLNSLGNGKTQLFFVRCVTSRITWWMCDDYTLPFTYAIVIYLGVEVEVLYNCTATVWNFITRFVESSENFQYELEGMLSEFVAVNEGHSPWEFVQRHIGIWISSWFGIHELMVVHMTPETYTRRRQPELLLKTLSKKRQLSSKKKVTTW